MAKKNNYKPSTKNYKSLKNDGMIIRGDFKAETAKGYIIAVIIAFHILPLCFVVFGEIGKQLLTLYCMTIINPVMIFVIMLLYGVRVGFNCKMPILCTFVSAISIMMYYDFGSNAAEGVLYYPLVSTVVMFFVYGIFSYASNLIGAFIKHFLV
ncbi:MAG: hypothetical protein ACI4TH_07405 [Candidatus Ornithomonoglobus sp.]